MPVSMYQLSSTRLILERARLLLREREDLSARVLLGGVGEISAGIAVLEASSAPTPEDMADLFGRAKVLIERTRVYAEGHRLHFLEVITPVAGPLRHDTGPFDTAELLARIAGMEKGATALPADMQRLVEEEQRVSSDTIPTPPGHDVTTARTSTPGSAALHVRRVPNAPGKPTSSASQPLMSACCKSVPTYRTVSKRPTAEVPVRTVEHSRRSARYGFCSWPWNVIVLFEALNVPPPATRTMFNAMF